MADADENIPAVYFRPLVEHLQSTGLDIGALLASHGMTLDVLSRPGAVVSVARAASLAEEIERQLGTPLALLGIALGRQLRTTAHGHLGFAVMTAPTVREGLDLAMRLIPIRTMALGLSLEIEEGEAFLRIDELVDLGRARELVLSALLVGIWQNAEALTRQRLTGQAEFSFPAPPFPAPPFPAPSDRISDSLAAPRASDLLQRAGSVRFGCSVSGLRFDEAYLDLPFAMSDPVAHELALEQCEAELAQVAPARRFVRAVRAALKSPSGEFRAQPELAETLGTSQRTLKRRLSEAGTTFSELLDEERRLAAVRLLRAGQTVDQVAWELGYANAANFSRAFKRWYSMPPGAWRDSSH